MLCCNYNRNPSNSIGNYSGPPILATGVSCISHAAIKWCIGHDDNRGGDDDDLDDGIRDAARRVIVSRIVMSLTATANWKFLMLMLVMRLVLSMLLCC